ncbi:hypothetical protein VTJ04DRAFT_2673 [Mycothermus thermophilus]|uniref:uncharacterized protein n=1 Tax=Humicola insolens TaxID=85995 RepID=UPI0037424D5E
MADPQRGQQGPQPGAGNLFLNLSSNNPFRKAATATSPTTATSPPVSPFDDPPPRPVSRNPFLDPALTGRSSLSNLRTSSEMSNDKRPSLTAEEIFGSLTLDDKPAKPAPPPPDGRRPSGPPGPMPPGRRGPPPPNRDGVPPPNRRPGPLPNHRPTHSQEEAMRARRMPQGPERQGRLDPDRSPQRQPDRRPRRNSDSSVMDTDKNMTEEERKQREMRRRERERERERRHREQSKRVNRKIDIIDQLDATGIYGSGIFHHDGPFDALNPHRNRQGSRRAPMQAFPEGSLNNTLGGSGPLNARPDHSAFLGHGEDEAFKEWSKPSRSNGEMPVFDPLSRGAILHGDESLGLGTSTFLEGTPAARTAIQKREEERAQEMLNEGLQRKKSLAHRIRNIKGGGRDAAAAAAARANDGLYRSHRSPSGSGPNERTPFFNEYNSRGNDEEAFTVRKTETNGSRDGGPTLERRSTTDGINLIDVSVPSEQNQAPPVPAAGAGAAVPPPPKPTGILGRMKSLKGRRQRPAPPPPDAGAPPGTAV